MLTSEGWQQLIESRAWLRRYSLANLIMILRQCPEATDVRPLSEWKELGFGYMRKGTHKIKIWKPRFRKVDVDSSDDSEETAQVSRLSGFMLVPVVDVSQLQGDPRTALPLTPSPVVLVGDAPTGLWEGIARQIRARGYTVERGDCGEANGLTHFTDRRVIIRPDLGPAQAAKTLTHELAHIVCGHEKRYTSIPRALMEVEAESVACIVSSVCGLDSLSYSVPYVAHWAADREVARLSAERVLKVADEILHQLEGLNPPR
nr:LtrC-like protein [Kibdelosporangium sp. MJ126-NF4]